MKDVPVLNRPSTSPLSQAFAVLRPGPFRRYIIGESISMTGTWMQTMAQAWVMTTLTQSAFMLGMVNFATGVPMLLLTMAGGSAADRFDKRRILLVAQVVQIALAVLMGYLVMRGVVQLWHVFVVATLLGIVQSFELPAAAALVPELVDKEEIAGAIALDRSVFHATRLVGPAAAGGLIGLMGAAMAFFANAFSFLALMVAIWTLPSRSKGTEEEEARRRGGIKDGFAYVRQDRPTLAMIGVMALTTVFVFPVMTVLMPLYARESLALDAAGMGILMAVSGIGSLTGSIGLLTVSRERRLGRMGLAVGGVFLGLAGLALATNLIVGGISLVALAVSVSTLVGLANTTVQERAPDHLRGRVSAVAGLSFFGLMPLAGLVVTGLSDLIGIRPALLIAAGIYVMAAGLMLLGPGRAIRYIPSPEESPDSTSAPVG